MSQISRADFLNSIILEEAEEALRQKNQTEEQVPVEVAEVVVEDGAEASGGELQIDTDIKPDEGYEEDFQPGENCDHDLDGLWVDCKMKPNHVHKNVDFICSKCDCRILASVCGYCSTRKEK